LRQDYKLAWQGKSGDSMCGICGILYRDSQRSLDSRILKDMARVIAHRGPNDEGFYTHQNIGLAVKRLSIIDIVGGHQPMVNEDESVVVVFNGEIYNHLSIKKDLEARGHVFKTRCDTEVLVHLYEEYGRHMVDHLNGMFAFAVYDQKQRRLLLARDRLGIKPLYYVNTKDWFLFSSEIKSFLSFPEFYRELNLEALHHYLTFRFVPAPMTMLKGVDRLPAGFLLEYLPSSQCTNTRSYWDISFQRGEGDRSVAESAEVLRELLHDAVKIRLMSEVPLGAMLSGGVDSSVILSRMTEAAEQTVSSFTIAYEEEGPHNEGTYAKIAAEAFKSDHHEILVRLDDFIENLERMVYFMDEPLADPAAIPIYDLCRFSKQFVTVLLSGVGGDELFGGYDVYREAIYSVYVSHMPRCFWNMVVLPLYRWMPDGIVGKNFVRRVNQPIEDVFFGSSFIYGGFSEQEKATLYNEEFAREQSAFDSHDVVRETLKGVSQASRLHKMLYVDTKHWLADSHLIMMDKMSMANSIELRAPLLDHRLVELAAALPERSKVNLLRSKIIFKEAFRAEIPKPIIARRKRGFSTPINLWLKNAESDLSEILLNQGGIAKDIFKKEAIINLLERHKQERGDFSASLFTLLVLNLWFIMFLEA
jgi:asparagine synthase (glutamine-hydrolysing)